MFYEDLEPAFRFGDVVTGYVITTPEIKTPILSVKDKFYNIDVKLQPLSVILTPCCNIGQKQVTLTPLLPLNIDKTIFRNPFFVEDMTRINFIVDPENSVPPARWERLNEDEKQEILNEKPGYTYLYYFVYDKSELLPKYSFDLGRTEAEIVGKNEIETNQYLIDFRRSYTIRCDEIITSTNAPLNSKILQLSMQMRNQLRDKISFYYGRIPIEDQY